MAGTGPAMTGKKEYAVRATAGLIRPRSLSMRAQLLTAIGQPLVAAEMPAPHPGPAQVLIKGHACAVCRTDLHVVDGELPAPKLPLIPGHEIVGSVGAKGSEVDRF